MVSITIPTSGTSVPVNSSFNIQGTTSEASPGSITSVVFSLGGGSLNPDNFTFTPSLPQESATFNGTVNLPICVNSQAVVGTVTLNATAYDNSSPPNSAQWPVSITIVNPGACSATNCGIDVCGKPCPTTCGGLTPICCAAGKTCNSLTSPNIITSCPQGQACLGTCSTCTASPACPSASYNCGQDACGNSCGRLVQFHQQHHVMLRALQLNVRGVS